MASMGNSIIAKWQTQTESSSGMFNRYLDGNLDNIAPDNLLAVHPFDTFSAMYHGMDWIVDWAANLSDEEVQFVRGNVWNFCVTYQADGRVPTEVALRTSNSRLRQSTVALRS